MEGKVNTTCYRPPSLAPALVETTYEPSAFTLDDDADKIVGD
jgi:hypothetical protein